MCGMFKPPPHALGMAQSILGGLCRSLRPPVCDGCLARFQNRLSDEARPVEAK